MTGYDERRRRLLAVLGEQAPRVFLTKDAATIRYVTGFSGSNGLLVGCDGEFTLITDGRYRDQADAQAEGVRVVIDRDAIGAALRLSGGREVTVDPSLDVGSMARLQASGAQVRAADAAIGHVRGVKDASELSLIERACGITAAALTQLADEIRLGMTEIAIARRLETLFGEMGATDRAFPTIVASGENSAIPHHRPTARPLGDGDLLVIDCGALVEGYHSDMTRTFVAGTRAQDWQREIHAVVEAAQEAGRRAIGPGVVARQVDAAARSVVHAAGYGDAFTHGTGHGVGLQIHEAPMISHASADTITAAMVLTVEPGIYLPGRGGVRIEDTLVVEGTARVLTEAPRHLRAVG